MKEYESHRTKITKNKLMSETPKISWSGKYEDGTKEGFSSTWYSTKQFSFPVSKTQSKKHLIETVKDFSFECEWDYEDDS